MAFTDHCDVFGAFHEDGFNRIIDHIRFQRPSMFNYATQAIADNPALLCRPIVAHPRLNQHGNPLVTIIDPLPLPGSNFALNFSCSSSTSRSTSTRRTWSTLPPELARWACSGSRSASACARGSAARPPRRSSDTSRRRRTRTRTRTSRRRRRRPRWCCRPISS